MEKKLFTVCMLLKKYINNIFLNARISLLEIFEALDQCRESSYI